MKTGVAPSNLICKVIRRRLTSHQAYVKTVYNGTETFLGPRI